MATFLLCDELGAPRRFPSWTIASVELARLVPGAAAPGAGLVRPAVGEGTRTFHTRLGFRVWIEARRTRKGAR